MENVNFNLEHNKESDFRELGKIDRWGGVLETNLDKQSLIDELKDYVSRKDIKLLGYLEETEDGTEYHFNRYPRKKYGPVPNPEQLDQLLAELGNNFGKIKKEVGLSKTFNVKVLLGLSEGYEGEIIHTVNEAINFLGNKFLVKPVDIFSLSKESEYHEEAIVIESDLTLLDKIYDLADKFKQHRFAVEDFKTGTINMVETRWCSDSDEE